MNIKSLFFRSVGLHLALLGILAFTPVFAETSDGITQAEQKLFARDYSTETMEDRLSRLENVIFGQAQKGDLQIRQQKLQNIFSENLVKPAELPKDDLRDNSQESADQTPPAPKFKDATDYPAVTQLEQQVFKQTYVNDDVATRLSRLEKQVFQQSFDELPMVDRVDQLTLKIIPQSPLGVEENTFSGLPNTGKELAPSNLAVYSQLTSLEEQVLGKSFGGELIAQRITRLEKQVFGAPQKGTIDARMNNLLTHYAPKQTQQSASVGAPQAYVPNNPFPPSGLMHPSEPQQIIVGGMMGGQQFSPEFLNMLPPAVRQRFNASGTGTVVGAPQQQDDTQPQVYSGPSSWTYTQETIVPYSSTPLYLPPGQTYRGNAYAQPRTVIPYTPQQQPMQQVNPMNFPGGALGPILQPQPQQIPGQINMGNAPFQGAMANNLNQSVVIMEYQIFGRSYEGSNLMVRLNNLEQQVFGRSYPQYSFQQRINRLMRQTNYRQSTLPRQKPLIARQTGVKGILGQALNMMMNQSGNTGYTPYGSSIDPLYQQPVYQQQTISQPAW